MEASAAAIKEAAAEKLGMNEPGTELILAEVKSTGERCPFKDSEVSIGSLI